MERHFPITRNTYLKYIMVRTGTDGRGERLLPRTTSMYIRPEIYQEFGRRELELDKVFVEMVKTIKP